MDELITIGQIIKSVGLKGEVKIKPLTNDINRFEKLKSVLIDNIPFRINSLRINPPFVYIKFFSVEDKTKADSLKDKFILVDRVHSIELSENEYFISDLINSTFFLDGIEAGKVTQINQFGSADIINVKLNDGRLMMFPFLNKLNLNIDINKREIYAKRDLIEEVCVYEN